VVAVDIRSLFASGHTGQVVENKSTIHYWLERRHSTHIFETLASPAVFPFNLQYVTGEECPDKGSLFRFPRLIRWMSPS
jgi:hypothetical protein